MEKFKNMEEYKKLPDFLKKHVYLLEEKLAKTGREILADENRDNLMQTLTRVASVSNALNSPSDVMSIITAKGRLQEVTGTDNLQKAMVYINLGKLKFQKNPSRVSDILLDIATTTPEQAAKANEQLSKRNALRKEQENRKLDEAMYKKALQLKAEATKVPSGAHTFTEKDKKALENDREIRKDWERMRQNYLKSKKGKTN